MEIDRSRLKPLTYNKNVFAFSAVFIFSFLLFNFAYLLEDWFCGIMNVATYLTWHNLFEFTSILVSFGVFTVSYYTFDQTGDVRFLFLGSVFLSVGLIDMFHTLSFKGMPDFFVPNDSANRATTFWIIARLIAAAGFLATGFIPSHTKCMLKKSIFSMSSFILSIAVLVVVVWFPDILPPMYIENAGGLTKTKIVLEYIVIAIFIAAIITMLFDYKRSGDMSDISLSCALIVTIFSELAFVRYNRVYDIYNYLGHVYKFIAYFIIFRVVFIHNVQKPYNELSQAQNELRNYAENLDKLVEQKTGQLRKMNRKLLEDLEYARDIQRSLLPLHLPLEDGVSFSAGYFPAERVSGDFYNIFKIDEHNIGLYIGDVSGHGVPAAMLTVFAKQSIKSRKETENGTYEIYSPASVLDNVFKSFNSTNFKGEVYFVMLYGVFNRNTRELTYASAGINVPPLILRRNGTVEELPIRGLPICKISDIYPVKYEDSVIALNKGDKLLFYTDGLIEADNIDGEMYSARRLKKLLEKNSSKSASGLSESIVKDVFDFTNPGRLVDDITFFTMEVI